MPERDAFHDAVENALVKDGWKITHHHLFIHFGGVDMYVDLGAEKIVAAEKDGQQIAVEVKSFIGTSIISEFHKALGQFLNYRLGLEEQEPTRTLYLAVPLDTYKEFFMLPFGQIVIKRHELKLLIYDANKEVIVQWQN